MNRNDNSCPAQKAGAKEKLPDLDSRLLMTAAFVNPGKRLADIGTDHAYLPVYLVLTGITPFAIAADTADGPLYNAEKTVRKYAAADKVCCRKSDGLFALSPEEAEEIVIAGMGGDLMVSILEKADWIRRDTVHLILQPMTHSEDVRRFLCRNGFSIFDEKAVCDGTKTYIALSAGYTGDRRYADDAFYFYFGNHPNLSGEASVNYVKRQRNRIAKKCQGLTISGKEKELREELESVLTHYENMRKDT